MQQPIYVEYGPDGMMRPVPVDANGNPIYSSNPGGPTRSQQQQAAAADLAGQTAGTATSGYLASQMFTPVSPAAATATEGALGIGAGAQGASAMTPVAGSAPMTAGAPAAAEGAGLFGAGFLAPAALAGLGAYTAYTGLQGHKAGQNQGGGAMGGLKAGIKEAGWLNAVPVLGQAAWLGGAAGGMFGSKKGKDQRSRDEGRGRLEQLGLRDAGNRGFYTLPDGTQVDISTVGPNGGPSYNLDEGQFSNPEFGEDVGTLNALIGAAGGGNGKRTSDLVGEQVNIYNGRGGSRAAVRDVKSKIEAAGGGANDIKHAAAEAWKRGEITAGERDARFAATDKLYGIKNTSGGRWEDGAGLSDNERKRNDKELGRDQNSTRTAPKRGR